MVAVKMIAAQPVPLRAHALFLLELMQREDVVCVHMLLAERRLQVPPIDPVMTQ